MTTSENEWYNKCQKATESNTTSDNKWQRVTAVAQRMKMAQVNVK